MISWFRNLKLELLGRENSSCIQHLIQYLISSLQNINSKLGITDLSKYFRLFYFYIYVLLFLIMHHRMYGLEDSLEIIYFNQHSTTRRIPCQCILTIHPSLNNFSVVKSIILQGIQFHYWTAHTIRKILWGPIKINFLVI